MHLTTAIVASLLSFGVFTTGARAADPGKLGMEFHTIVKGNTAPTLTFAPLVGVRSIVVALEGSDGSRQTLRVGTLGAGGRKSVPFRAAMGQTKFKAVVDAVWASGDKDHYDLEFEATRVGDLKIQIANEDVDMAGRHLRCHATNPIRNIDLSIYGEEGDLLWTGSERFDPPVAAGGDVAIAWAELKEKVARMDLKVTDVAGFWSGMKVSVFAIEIPHDEVVFASGQSAIQAAETPKLERTMGFIKDAIKKYGTLAELQLFVGGYTDTVSDKASNRALSMARAAAIATWFRGHGLKIPVFYWGYGEEVLAVPTPDETEEQRNRRAVYILSSHPPQGKDVPYNSWRRL